MKLKIKELERKLYNMTEDMTVAEEDYDAELFSLKQLQKFDPTSSGSETEEEAEDSDFDSEGEYLKFIAQEAETHYETVAKPRKRLSKSEEKKAARAEAKHGFEEVSAEETAGLKRRAGNSEEVKTMPANSDDDAALDTTSDSEGVDDIDYDSDVAAEHLAIAQKMIRKTDREELIDDAYNRYSFNDTDLPSWFVDEEQEHVFKHKPITKEEVEAMKERLREIDARPIKKVAEANARNKLMLNRKLEKIKKKARDIAGDSSMTGAEKLKAINRSYKAVKHMVKKPERVYVVSRRFQQGTKHAGGIGKKRSRVRFVDARMKKDSRNEAIEGSKRTGKKSLARQRKRK
ncbi:hypothetical protein GEMRC1_008196 [Eukaryota sp. GEM-RC1]